MVDSPTPRKAPEKERFELRAKLGAGGMGVVYRAWDRALGKEVALKRVRKVDSTWARQLKLEFRTRSALRHRNLVQLFELVIEGEDTFFTMELLEGTDLVSWVRGGTEAVSPSEQPLTAETERESPQARTRGATPSGTRAKSGSGSGGSAGGRPKTRREGATPIDAAGIERLHAALIELCTGLAVLHESGIVHRDVTPANVRVTPSKRVVLLDFGLAASTTVNDARSSGVIAGTPRYMAPEQVRGEQVTSAADMYAVGGIVYELLTGRSAFGGSVRTMQVDKGAGARPEPIAQEGTDPLLAALAIDLLDPEPPARPSARAVLERLGAAAASTPSIAPTFGLAAPGAVVGRKSEAAVLEAAFARVRAEKRPIAVIVEGSSGIGKTTLIRHVLARAGREDPNALLLASRCHPQETIPFKALDAAMDALAARASTIADLGAFAPGHAYAATRLFPVLRAVPELARHSPGEAALDDADVRAQGFEALRDLFARLAARGPVTVWIDDVQWDDADSLALVEALARGRAAPPVLFVLSLRTESRESAIVRRLSMPRAPMASERLRLEPLGPTDVARLAGGFLGEGDPRIARVVAESEGNAFLACELARYLATEGPHATRSEVPDVRALVAARVRDLNAAERALLVAASIAVRPLTIPCAIAAAGLAADAGTDVLALRDALLVRLGVSAAGETIAPYHDKIAEATEQLVPTGERAAIHRAVAEAIEALEPGDDDALWVHWEGAGEIARAAEHAYKAAEHAARTLAFDRAAALFEKSIDLGFDRVERAIVLEQAAAAHANHGRAPLAAGRYLDASRALGDDVGDARVRTLKRLAAEQYVKSGYVRRGWGVMRSVLDAAHIPQPASPTRATLDALGRRLKFLTRRVDVDAIGDRKTPEGDRARLDILWTASTSMSMVNVTLSDAFRTLHLARILDVGDASAVARALAYEVALEVHVGGKLFDWHAARLLRHARRLVEQTSDPYDRAWLGLAVANQAYCAGRFRDAVAACRSSGRILREECRGVAWEISTVSTFLLTSLAMLGELGELREAAERFTLDAEARGDLSGVAEGYSGECILAWWMAGSGEEALARASEAVSRQGADAERWPEKSYRRGELTELMGVVHLRLLARDPWPAWRSILAQWGGLKSALIPSLQFYRAWVRHGRARAALAAAATLGPKEAREGWTRAKLLRDVRTMIEVIGKDPHIRSAHRGPRSSRGRSRSERGIECARSRRSSARSSGSIARRWRSTARRRATGSA